MSKTKERKRGYVGYALMYLVAGLILLACPEITTKTITYSVAVVFVVMGLAQIASYFRMEPDLASTNTGFVTGTIVTLMGVFIFLKSEVVISIIPVILGFLVIVSGTLKLQHAINLYRIKMSGVKVILAFALFNIVLGIITVFNPFKTVIVLMRVMGIGLILSGATDLFSAFYLAKQFRKYSKNVENKCIEDKQK